MTTQTERAQSDTGPLPGRRPEPGHAVNRAWIVLRKELRETFRDKRIVFSVIISPLLITPLMMALMGAMINKQIKQAREETYTVGLVGAKNAPSIRAALRGAPNLRFEEEGTRAEAERQVRERTLRAAVVLPSDAESRMKEGRTVPIPILIDPGNDTSRSASSRLQELFRQRGQQIVTQRLVKSGLSPELAVPFRLDEQPVPGGGTGATMLLAMFLPYILVLSTLVGGIHAANDLVAGEKERGTLETLLVSPASRRDLVLGKFTAVVVVCLVSSFLSIVGLMLPFLIPVHAFAWLAQGGLKLSPAAVLVMLLVQLPLAVFGAGLLLTVSTVSRNQKEAQTYLAPLLIIATVPAVLSLMMQAEAGWPLALVPILNAALVLKQALSGIFNPVFIVVAFGASIAYAALALLFATHLFEKESVLLKA